MQGGGFRHSGALDCSRAGSLIGTAARRGVGAYQAIQQTLRGQDVSYLG